MLGFNLNKYNNFRLIIYMFLIILTILSIFGCSSDGKSSDDNNSTSEGDNLPIISKADLIVSEFSAPNSIKNPDDFYIDLAVKNRGTKDISKSFVVGLYLSLSKEMDKNSTFLVGTYVMDKLGAGSTEYIYDFTIHPSSDIPVIPNATYYMRVEVDNDNNVTESNEKNNFSEIHGVKLNTPQIYIPNFADSYEDDDTKEDASELKLNTVQKHNFYDDTKDWSVIYLLSNREYTFKTINLGQYADTHLTLVNELLDVNISDDNGGDEGNNSSKIVIKPKLGDTFFLLVSSTKGGVGVGHEYSLVVSERIVSSKDTYEDDDVQTDAKPIYVDRVQEHNFYDDGSDWLYFDATKDANYTIETENIGVDANTELVLYDMDGVTELMRDNNSSNGSNGGSLLGWKAPTTGRYYIDVVSVDEAMGDNRHYRVKLIENRE